MSKISRSNISVKSESGGEWFEEFLRICRDQQDVFNIIVGNKSESINEVVQKYRTMVGLDLVNSEETKSNISKVAQTTFLSIRHARLAIGQTNDPDISQIKQIIDSFCRHSGGTKGTHSIINYLREKFGHQSIKFSDKELIKYIEECKEHYKNHTSENQSAIDVGRVGTDKQDFYEDSVADYINNGK